MARPEGFEPPTHGLEGRCSIQLSYGHTLRRIALAMSTGLLPEKRLLDTVEAGDGNRTHVSSLEGWCSTIELHPRICTDDDIAKMNRGDRIRTCDLLVPNQAL